MARYCNQCKKLYDANLETCPYCSAAEAVPPTEKIEPGSLRPPAEFNLAATEPDAVADAHAAAPPHSLKSTQEVDLPLEEIESLERSALEAEEPLPYMEDAETVEIGPEDAAHPESLSSVDLQEISTKGMTPSRRREQDRKTEVETDVPAEAPAVEEYADLSPIHGDDTSAVDLGAEPAEAPRAPSDLHLVSEAFEAGISGVSGVKLDEAAREAARAPAEASGSAVDLGAAGKEGSSSFDFGKAPEKVSSSEGKRPPSMGEIVLMQEASAVNLSEMPAETGEKPPSSRDLIAEAVESGVDIQQPLAESPSTVLADEMLVPRPTKDDSGSSVDLGAAFREDRDSHHKVTQPAVDLPDVGEETTLDEVGAGEGSAVRLDQLARTELVPEGSDVILGADSGTKTEEPESVHIGGGPATTPEGSSDVIFTGPDDETPKSPEPIKPPPGPISITDQMGGDDQPTGKPGKGLRVGTGSLIGGGVGALVGAGLCFAGLWLGGVLKFGSEPQQQGRSSTPPGPGMAIQPRTGQQVPEGNAPAPEDSAVARVGQGKQLLREYLKNRDLKQQPLVEADDKVQAALKSLNEAKDGANANPATNAERLLWVGVVKEMARNEPAALEHYKEAQKTFEPNTKEWWIFQAAIDRLESGSGRLVSDLRGAPAGADLFAQLVLLVTALQAEGNAGKPEPDEAGFRFWQAARLARQGKFTEAQTAVRQARDTYKKRLAEDPNLPNPNPLSDPQAQLFLACCEELDGYWGLRQTLKESGGSEGVKVALQAGKRAEEALDRVAADVKVAQKRPPATKPEDLAALQEWLGDLDKHLKAAMNSGAGNAVAANTFNQLAAQLGIKQPQPTDAAGQSAWLKGLEDEVRKAVEAKKAGEGNRARLDAILAKLKDDKVRVVVDAAVLELSKYDPGKDLVQEKPDAVVGELAARLDAIRVHLSSAKVTDPDPAKRPADAVKTLTDRLGHVVRTVTPDDVSPERKALLESLLREKGIDPAAEPARAVEESLALLQEVARHLQPNFLAKNAWKPADVVKGVDKAVTLSSVVKGSERDTILALKDEIDQVRRAWTAPQAMLDTVLASDPSQELGGWPKPMADRVAANADAVLADPNANAADKAKARMALGLARWSQRRFDEARKALDEALRDGKDAAWREEAGKAMLALKDPNAYFLPRAEQLVQSGQAAAAERLLNRGVGAFSDARANGRLLAMRCQVRLELARAGDRSKLAEAGQDAQEAIRAGAVAPGSFAAGRVAEEQKDAAGAVQFYGEALKAHPPKVGADARYVLELNRYRKALARTLLGQVSPLSASNEPARTSDRRRESHQLPAVLTGLLETILLVEDQPAGSALPTRPEPFDPRVKQAKDLAEQAIKAGDNEGYLLLARVLMLEGLWTQALQEYATGMMKLSQEDPPRIRPEYARVLHDLVQGHPGFQRPSPLQPPEPQLAELHFAAGMRRYQARQYAQAEEDFARAHELFGQDARYVYFLGLSKLMQGKRDAAAEDFRLAAKLEQQGHPRPSVVNQALERVQGDARKALEEFRR